MSQNLPTLAVSDRRTDFRLTKQNVCTVGGRQVNYFSLQFPTPQLGSGCNNSYTISDSQALDLNTYLHFACTGTITCTGTGTTNIALGRIGLSEDALYQLITSMTFIVGGESQTWSNINTSINLINSVRRNCMTDWSYYSAAPRVQDNCRNFGDLYGTNKNVLGAWYQNGLGKGENTRISELRFTNIAAGVGPTTGTSNYTMELFVPLTVGPLSGTYKRTPGFVKPGTISMQVNLVSAINPAFSLDPTYLSAVTFNNPTITDFSWCFSTIDISKDLFNIPPQVYPSYRWEYNTQSIASLGTGITQISINPIVFPTQPELLIVAVRPPYGSKTVFNPTYYFPILGCNLNYIQNNVINIQPGPQQKHLYDICLNNGINMDYPTWAGQDISAGLAGVNPLYLGGGFLVLNPVLDLTSGNGNVTQSAGTVQTGGGYQFSGQINISNTTGSAVAAEIVLLRYIPQQYEDYGGGQYRQHDIMVNTADIHYLKDVFVDYNELINDSSIAGDGFKSFIKAAAKGVGKYAKTVANNVKDYVEQNPQQALQLATTAAKYLSGSGVLSASDMAKQIDNNSRSMRSRLDY